MKFAHTESLKWVCVCVGGKESNGNNCNKVIKQNSAKNPKKKKKREKMNIQQNSIVIWYVFCCWGEFNMFYYIYYKGLDKKYGILSAEAEVAFRMGENWEF